MAFAVTAMMGSSCRSGNLADLLDGRDAVHLGHHDVHENDVDGRILPHVLDGLTAVVRGDHRHALLVEDGGERENIPHVVIDDEYLPIGEHLLRLAQRFELLARLLAERVEAAVEEEYSLLQQSLARRGLA